jgi:predicted TIM-barrel fold metal-dependent hydrolase
MLAADTKLISVDDHVIEPPHTWVDRLPARYKSVGPRIEQRADGLDVWRYEDQQVPIMAGTVRFLPDAQRRPEGANFDQMRPGCYDPKQRLLDMDLDGVWAQVCFPNFARFAGHRFLPTNDPALSLLCIQAYNDFIVDEWCAVNADRLVPLILIPFWDVDASIAEIKRLGSQVKAVAFSENPTVLDLPSVHTDHYERLWATVVEYDLALCMHIGSSSVMVTSSPDAPISVQWAATGINSMLAMADWIFSGIFDRFPSMRVLLSEGGAGWVPYILERSQKFVDICGGPSACGVKKTPHEYFRDNMFACLVTDEFAIESRHTIGIDNIMWEGDYPHSDGLFPNSRVNLDRVLADVPEDEARKICQSNAQRAFRLQ